MQGIKDCTSGQSIMLRSSIKVVAILILSICSAVSVRAATYYVSLSGNDNWPGTSPDSAWRHIAHAGSLVVAGDSALIDTGTYVDEHVTVINSGNSASIIVFEGYNGKPVLDGIDRTGTGIDIVSKNYIVLKDLRIVNYRRGINFHYAEHGVAENLIVDGMGEDDGNCIALRGARFCEARNCTLTDGTHMNFYLWSAKNCLIENCILNSIDTAHGAVDYHIYMEESDSNTIRNCIARNFHPHIDIHAGHAIALKFDCDHNLIIGCKAYDVGEFFVAAHYSHHNEFRECIGFDEGGYHSLHWNFGLVARDGAYDNKFINCRMFGATNGILIVRTSESPETTMTVNNTFENCIICSYEYGHPFAWNEAYTIQIHNAKYNTIKNCVIGGSHYLMILGSPTVDEGNVIKNTIIVDHPHYFYGQSPSFTFSYCDFWNVGFTPPSGTGNINTDPLFANHDTTTPGDYHLMSEYGRWNGSAWVNDDTTSPCIDAGDPADDYSNEPEPNGDRINMGAYGNTEQASKSPEPGIAETNENLSGVCALYQNIPNPFSQMTTIKFQIPEGVDSKQKSVVSIKIYDANGRLVRQWDYPTIRLSKRISWGGRDDKGRMLPSGAYFCRLEAGDFRDIKKLLILR